MLRITEDFQCRYVRVWLSPEDTNNSRPGWDFHCNGQAVSLLCENHLGPFTFHCTICIFIHDNKFIFLQNSLLCYDNLMSGESLQRKQLENHSHAYMLEWNYWRLDSALIIFFPPQVENVYSACWDKSHRSVQSRGTNTDRLMVRLNHGKDLF